MMCNRVLAFLRDHETIPGTKVLSTEGLNLGTFGLAIQISMLFSYVIFSGS